MKLMICALALLLSACASNPATKGTKPVSIVLELNESCKYIRMQNCESRRENGKKRCYRRLKKMAVEAGADTVLIDDIIEHSELIQLDNNAFGDNKTIVETRLYQCHLD